MKKYFKNKTVLFAVFTIIVMSAGTVALKNGNAKADKKTGTVSTLSNVESEYVCMVTDRVFPEKQIPVEVNGKTYYGCCEMCKAQLMDNAAKRYAVDPVSGNKTDKASSVIGMDSSGAVYYFENSENLIYFNNTGGKQHE